MKKSNKTKSKPFTELKEKQYYCKECGQYISSFCRDMSEYVYKLRKNTKKRYQEDCEEENEDINNHTYYYYCSYHCYNKALKRREEQDSKEEKVKKLNKFNGVLSLREIDLVEDICAICEDKFNGYTHSVPQINIHSKEDFQKFLVKHSKELKECIEYYSDLEEEDHLSTYLPAETDEIKKVKKNSHRRTK